MIKAYFDGSCKYNPGEVGSYGFHIKHPIFTEACGLIKGDVTSNVAEYVALTELLKELKLLKIQKAQIYGDSSLIIKTVNRESGVKKGMWTPHKKHPILNKYAKKARNLLVKGGHKLSWIPRDKNATADFIAGTAYNENYINQRNAIYVYNPKTKTLFE